MLFGIPRTCTAEYVSYSALEELKDGIFFSGKYESSMVMTNNLHIFVFANFEPDRSKLSKDRWEIHYVGQKKRVAPIFTAKSEPLEDEEAGYARELPEGKGAAAASKKFKPAFPPKSEFEFTA